MVRREGGFGDQGGAQAAYRPPHPERDCDAVKRDFRDYLGDILTAIDDIADFTRGVSFHTFVQDRKTINAVVRSLECSAKQPNASLTTCAMKRPVFHGNR